MSIELPEAKILSEQMNNELKGKQIKAYHLHDFERFNGNGAIFIDTVRPLDSWLVSCSQHFRGVSNIKLRTSFFGCAKFNNELFTKAWHRHNERVKEFSKNNEVHIFNIWEGDGFEKLSEITGRSSPNKSFPRENRRCSR